MAAGVVVTFLPLAVTGGPANLAAVGLFVQAVVATVSRWWAGRFGDRHGPAVLLVPGVVATAAGMLALVLIDRPVAVVAGMVLFGSGFGVTQNASMTLMLNRVAPSGYGTVSAIWNLAFDAGIGAGAFGFGVVAARTGYPAAFAATAARCWSPWSRRAGPRRPRGPTLGCIQAAFGGQRLASAGSCCIQPVCRARPRRRTRPSGTGSSAGASRWGGGCARRSWPAASG